MSDVSTVDDLNSDLGFGATLRGFNSGHRLFDRYTLKEILGRGGMGIVWRALDEQLERDVALKFLPEMVTFDEQAVGDLKRETKKSQELRHHHIVQVYDFVSDKRSACIAMEYVDGPTLSALKARKERSCLEIDEIREWVEQLCEALAYAHQRAHVVHRDLKPANLMIDSKNELKVTDFGIARSVSDSASMLTLGRGTSGTLVYMSPQQLGGQRASHLDDIYSVGASIYELLTSKPPFYSGDVTDQIKSAMPISMKHRREDLEIAGSPLPKQWEETVAACLAKDPVLRPQSAGELAKRLGLVAPWYQAPRVIGVAEVKPPEVRREEDTNAGGKRNRKLVVVGCVFAVLLIAGGLVWYSARKAEEKRLLAQRTQSETKALATQRGEQKAKEQADPRVKLAQQQCDEEFKRIELLKNERDELTRDLRPKHPKIVKLNDEIKRGEKWLEALRRIASQVPQLNERQQVELVKIERLKMERDELALDLRPKHPKLVSMNDEISQKEKFFEILREPAKNPP